MAFLKQTIGILLLCLLTACASPSDKLASGQKAFKNQDYHSAFKKLKPLAKDGNPQAQYAVGYMYYYGLGTTIDKPQAFMWMEKSANQGYAPATSALSKLGSQKNTQTQENPTFTGSYL